jgi:hypothetical protein
MGRTDGEKIAAATLLVGCATLLVAFWAGVANWLVVPGVLSSQTGTTSVRPSESPTRLPAPAPIVQTSVTPHTTVVPAPVAPVPVATNVKPPTVRTLSIDRIGIDPSILKILAQSVRRYEQPQTHNRFRFKFDACRYYRNQGLLYCYATVINQRSLERMAEVRCESDSTSIVDANGVAFSAAQCWLGRDWGVFYASDKLAPGVEYRLGALFRQPQLKLPTLRYLEFSFHDVSLAPKIVPSRVRFHDVMVLESHELPPDASTLFSPSS